MNESKVKELIMILRIYLRYGSTDGKNERQKLRDQLKKLVQELLPE